MSNQDQSNVFSSLKKKLNVSSGLSSAYESVSQTFRQMSKTAADNPQVTNAALGASLITTAINQLPPDMAQQMMDYVQTSFAQLSQSPIVHGVISQTPQVSTVSGLSSNFSRAVKEPILPAGETAVGKMQTPLGFISAYWTSEKWAEAWGLTLGTFGLKTAHSASSVGMALSTAELISDITKYDTTNPETLAAIQASAGAVGAFYLGRKVLDEGGHYIGAQLHRLSAKWDAAQFRKAFKEKGVLPALTRETNSATKVKVPPNIDEILDEPLTMVKYDALNLSLGVWGAAGTLYFMSKEFLERSQKVEFLDRWADDFNGMVSNNISPELAQHINLAPGEYGTAILAAGAMAMYVTPMTWVAYKMSKSVKKNQRAMIEAGGQRRSDLQDTLKNSHLTAASDGEEVYQDVDERSYALVNRLWNKQIGLATVYQSFKETYDQGTRILSYVATAPAFLSGALTFDQAAANAEMLKGVMDGVSTPINLMPTYASLTAKTEKISNLAKAVEAAYQQDQFYSQTGVREFDYQTGEKGTGLSLKNVTLMKSSADGDEVIIQAEDVHFEQGTWTRISGESGCGKSTLLKAIVGFWPHGKGQISAPQGDRIFFATQTPDLPRMLSLKELVTYPSKGQAFEDEIVAEALHKVGLGKFAGKINEPDQKWHLTLSGGQQKKLLMTRILLHQPEILFLDEINAGLDAESDQTLHQLLADELPDSIVISILHGHPPLDGSGNEYFDNILRVENGKAILEPTPPPAFSLSQENDTLEI